MSAPIRVINDVLHDPITPNFISFIPIVAFQTELLIEAGAEICASDMKRRHSHLRRDNEVRIPRHSADAVVNR